MRTDLLNELPVEKRAKLLRIYSDREASHVALLAAGDALDAARSPITRFDQRKSDLEATIRDGDPRDAVAAKHQLEALEIDSRPFREQFDFRQKAKADREADYSTFDILAPVESELGDHRLARLHSGAKPLKAVPAPPIGKITDFKKAVTETRAQVAAKSDEIERTRLAPVPVKDQLAAATADLDQRAAKGAPDYDPRRRDKSPIDLGRMLGEHHIGDTFAWLHRNTIADRLRQMIGTDDAPGALSDADRERTIVQLEAEKLHAERVEEALICAAEAQGMRIARRRNASPLAILEIE